MKLMKLVPAAVVAAACAAAARAADGYEPPQDKWATDWISITIIGIAVVAIGALAFKSSRKTHLD